MYQHPLLLMAPRRDSTDTIMSSTMPSFQCCLPTGECLKSNALDYGLISMDHLHDSVKIVCTNENCAAGQYMHAECFEQWEQSVLSYLKSIGRARSWSDKQRQQNLWTKKGYDLVYKVCGCRCGRGHIKKDLDWSPPITTALFGVSKMDDECNKKKKKKNRNNQKPSLAITSTPNAAPQSKFGSSIDKVCSLLDQQLSVSTPPQSTIRGRAGSLTSSNGSSSPASSGNDDLSAISVSPIQNHRAIIKRRYVENAELYSERIRTTCGSNGIFSRRLDFSLYNILPKARINSIEVKIEDEGKHGNDDTRMFVLSSLAAHKKTHMACILCKEMMMVYDRYPLIDGTFFLSPIQHSKDCIETKFEGRTCYLTSVCIECLDGTIPEKIFRCRFCAEKWDGSALVMGTMYSFDIFAAMPCCTERLKCNNCFKLLLHPHQRLNFFSDYTHSVSCPYCQSQDTHFVKPLNYCYTNKPLQQFQQWP